MDGVHVNLWRVLRNAAAQSATSGQRPPRFWDLAFHMLRRVLEVAHWHVPGAGVDWKFQSPLQQCEKVRVAGADLRWLDW